MTVDDIAIRLRCPNEGETNHSGMSSYYLTVRRQLRGVRFRCTDCLLIFTMTDAEIRRLMVRRAVLG